jgi:hypothetical protein
VSNRYLDLYNIILLGDLDFVLGERDITFWAIGNIIFGGMHFWAKGTVFSQT